MKTEHPFKAGQVIKPRFDGEDQLGRKLHWTKLRGVVTSAWTEGGVKDNWTGRTDPVVHKVQVRWFKSAPYATRLEVDFVEAV